MAGKNRDRISELPDPLRYLIVSSLPFKESARTCILSKSWLNIWKSTKNIEFNELFFLKNGDSEETKEAQRRVFLNFISQWISEYQESAVHRFSLKVSNPKNCSETVERCVAFATQRGLKEFGLDFSDPTWSDEDCEDHVPLYQLPKHVYNLVSLESLKLYSCGFVMPHLLDFHALKDVSFGWVDVTITDLQALLSNCKAIENLSLKRCWNLAHFDMGEEPLRLTRLVIDKCNFAVDYFRFYAPNLKYYKYSGIVGISDIHVNRYVMEEAELDFDLEPEFNEYGNELYRFVEDLYPVRVLTVCCFLLQVLPSGDEPVRILGDMNVRHLIMKTQMHPYENIGYQFLLYSSPMLEKLTFDLGFGTIFPEYEPPYHVNPEKCWEHVVVYPCVRNTLRFVEVKGFRGTMNELMVLNYFIQAGRVLEKIDIKLLKEEDDDEAKLDLRCKVADVLLSFPRVSRNLEISIAF